MHTLIGMSMLTNLEALPDMPPDPIMAAGLAWPGIKQQYPDAINTTIGVVLDPATNGPWRSPTTIAAARKAFETIEAGSLYGYLPSSGYPEFRQAVAAVFVGIEDVSVQQSLGGTGALFLAKAAVLTLLQDRNSTSKERFPLLLDPGWPNHPTVFSSDFDITTYQHTAVETGTYNHQAAMEMVDTAPTGATVVLQAGGYNDDGLDRSQAEWDEILGAASDKALTVILDSAYMGLGREYQQDLYPIRRAAELGLLTLATLSMSKNMGFYSERLGALAAINLEAHFDKRLATKLTNSLSSAVIRGTYSNPPRQAAMAATSLLANPDYFAELDQLRQRLDTNRQTLAAVLGDRLPVVGNGRGIFTKLLPGGFSEAQQMFLLEHEHIQVLPNSRINIGGIRADQIERVGQSLLRALAI